MKVFGVLDRVIGGIIISLIFLAIYGKILSDFAQLYITGHTTHFLWILGDIANSPQQPGPYSLMAFIFVAVIGYANMVIWLGYLKIAYKLAKKLHRFLSKYEIRRKDNILVVRSKKGRVTK